MVGWYAGVKNSLDSSTGIPKVTVRCRAQRSIPAHTHTLSGRLRLCARLHHVRAVRTASLSQSAPSLCSLHMTQLYSPLCRDLVAGCLYKWAHHYHDVKDSDYRGL